MNDAADMLVETVCRKCGHKWLAAAMKLPLLSRPFVPTVCENCAEELQREAEARERAEQARRERMRRQQRDAAWEKLCPKEYRLTTEAGGKTVLARLELECKKLPEILAWKSTERGLVIRSRASGLSKTRAAWRLLRKHWIEGRHIVAFTAGAFQRYAQDEAGKFTLNTWFNRVACADILFLDDLGKGYWTENTEAVWFDLLEHRTSHGKPLIVTTNYTGDELIKASRSEATAYAVRRIKDFCDIIALD
jgi:hypothetical protein